MGSQIGLCRINQCSSACPLLNTLTSVAPEIPGSSSKRVNTLINVGFVISAASERLFLAPGFGTFAITRASYAFAATAQRSLPATTAPVRIESPFMLHRRFVDFGYMGTHYLPSSNLLDSGSVKYMPCNGTGRAGYAQSCRSCASNCACKNGAWLCKV